MITLGWVSDRCFSSTCCSVPSQNARDGWWPIPYLLLVGFSAEHVFCLPCAVSERASLVGDDK